MAVYAPRQPAMPSMGYAGGGPGAPQVHHPQPAHAGPSGSLPPGTKVQVGKYVVRIERFLSEGGFSHVYLATLVTPSSVEGFSPQENRFVLKRMAVPDKAGLAEVRKEVDAMKQLRPHRHIVYFIEASASSLPGGGGYEIFILMEHCPGGGIIDLLNSRLQNRLTESEILKIFSDTCEAVAHMHSQRPIMIHRDLKVENILVAAPNLYKLCDFGSVTTTAPRPPQTTQEIQALEADLNKHTTLQYRAPEMVDVWSRKGVDEKADIWALGVFLYKLCYYTTPFEDQGPLAIMNVQYKIPSYPAYSGKVKSLIGMMLQESARARPDVWTVYDECCKLRGISPRMVRPTPASQPIPTTSPPGLHTPHIPAHASSAPGRSSATTNGLDGILTSATSPPLTAEPVENVVPMRRGRPTKAKEGTDIEKSSRMARTGGPIVHEPHAEQPKPSWVVPRAATGDGAPAAPQGEKAKGTPGEGDLFAREAAAGFGDSFASPPPANGRGSFGDSFAPTKPPAAPLGVLMGSTHGLRPTPQPSPGPGSKNETTKTLSSAPAAGATSLAVPSTSKLDDHSVSPAEKITSSVAEAAKAIDEQSELASKTSHLTPPVIHTSHFGRSSPHYSFPVAHAASHAATHAGHAVAAPIHALGHLARGLGSQSRRHHSRSDPSRSELGRPDLSRPDLINRSSQTSPALAKAISLPSTSEPKPRPASMAQNPTPARDYLGDDDDDFEAPLPRSRSGLVDVNFEPKPTTKPHNKRLSMPIAPSALASSSANRERFKPRAQPSAVEEQPEPALPPRPKPKPASARSKSLASLSSDSSDDEPEHAAGEHYGDSPGHRRAPVDDDDFEAPTLQLSDRKALESSLLDTPNEMGPTPLPKTSTSSSSGTQRPVPAAKPTVPSAPPAAGPPVTSMPPEQLPPRPLSEMSEEDEDVVARRRAAIAKFAPPAAQPVAEEDVSVDRDPFASRAGNRSKSPEAKRPGGARGSGPPLRAPKPQSLRNSAAITSLVSRYETLSTDPVSSPISPPTSETSKPLPPASTGSKPAVPVKNVTGASSSGDRPRFRPTTMARPSSPPKASGGPVAGVRRAHIPRQSLGPGQLPPPLNLRAEDGAPAAQEEDGERFAGVSSLKSRWETGHLRRAEQQIRVPRTDYGQS